LIPERGRLVFEAIKFDNCMYGNWRCKVIVSGRHTTYENKKTNDPFSLGLFVF
jgi:hypothetical protein